MTKTKERLHGKPHRARGHVRTHVPGDRHAVRGADRPLATRLRRPRRFHTTLIAWLLALGALLLIGLALAMTARAEGLAPLRARTSDPVIADDLRQLDLLEHAVSAAPDADVWRKARATALIEAARNEYLDNDRTGFDVAAYAEARTLAASLTSGEAAVTRETVPAGRVLAGSTKVRPDLWEKLEAMKKSEGFACAAEDLARMEVQLLWAGNEQIDQGDCRTSPHVAQAEKLATDAAAKVDACRAPAPPVAVMPVEPVPQKPVPDGVVPVPAVPTPEELRIPRNVHFALDRYFISQRSNEVITGIVSVLKKYPSITVRLEGHTDSRASVAYNMRLSRNRVNAVQAVMVKQGIDPARITTAFKGEGDLKVTEDSKANFARNRRVEMVFVDSEGHDIQAEDQEEDLQLETDKQFKKGGADPNR